MDYLLPNQDRFKWNRKYAIYTASTRQNTAAINTKYLLSKYTTFSKMLHMSLLVSVFKNIVILFMSLLCTH